MDAAGLDNSAARMKVAQWQAVQRDFIKQTRLSRDYFRERAGRQMNSETIDLPNITIGRSLGAKAKNYDITDPITGENFNFTEGTHIQNAQVFAVKGVRTPLHDGVAEGLTKEFGGKIENWQHSKGIGIIDMHGEQVKAEVHRFQNSDVGKVKFKISRFIEE